MKKLDSLTRAIRQCQKGNNDGFTWMLHEYGSRLYSYFFRITGSKTEAEDLLQDLFVKLLEKIQIYQHDGRFENWLFRVAANLARDRGRQKKRAINTVSQFRNEENQENLLNQMEANQLTPPQLFEQTQQHDRLQKALMQLSPGDREIIMLRHFGNLSFNEIAETLDISIGTALSKVHRGLKKLRNIMVQYEK